MTLIRVSLILMLPFFAGAVLPWLTPSSAARVAVLTCAWAACCSLFFSGLCVGQVLNEAKLVARARLQLVSAMALACIALAIFVSLALAATLIAIVISMFALVAVQKLLVQTRAWQQLPATTSALIGRFIWVAVGCLLMLVLSVYRVQVSAPV